MRILSFSKMWPKLKEDKFTTFRWPRRDSDKGRDWYFTECLQIYYRQRSPDRKYLGIAKIVLKETKLICSIDDEEAIIDGFDNQGQMFHFLCGSIEKATPSQIINKLTLEWIEKCQ